MTQIRQVFRQIYRLIDNMLSRRDPVPIPTPTVPVPTDFITDTPAPTTPAPTTPEPITPAPTTPEPITPAPTPVSGTLLEVRRICEMCSLFIFALCLFTFISTKLKLETCLA